MNAVLVAIPARDESAEIDRCLEHVLASVEVARRAGQVGQVVVAVSAHRCVDTTYEQATRALGAAGVVVRDDTSPTVGGARAALVSAAAQRLGHDPRATWVLSTDADSWVPPDWITGTLAAAGRSMASAVAGMVELRGWTASPAARRRYAALVEAGTHPRGHDHVYGANLAVRLDRYLAVGGFTSPEGEDHDLVDRLRAAGDTVLTTLAPVVSTSARSPGRADHGLADLLRRLEASS